MYNECREENLENFEMLTWRKMQNVGWTVITTDDVTGFEPYTCKEEEKENINFIFPISYL